MRIQGDTLTYLRPMKNKERISFLITGFGAKRRTMISGSRIPLRRGVSVQGDQPLTRLNIFSIDKVQSVEPYIAIDLAPGEGKALELHLQLHRALIDIEPAVSDTRNLKVGSDHRLLSKSLRIEAVDRACPRCHALEARTVRKSVRVFL